MKIKEAAAKCGLTEKAIRLYEAKGLIAPDYTEKSGRMFRDYDDETVSRLQTIAALRRAFFSLEQIAVILETPERIPEIFAAYREELHENYAALKPLLAKAEAVDASALDSAEAVSAVMTAPAADSTAQVLPSLHFRVWDEEMSRDEREIAYARCQKYIAHWGRFYGAYLVFDTVCAWIGRSFKQITAVLAAMVVLALVLYYVPVPVRASRTVTGYELTYGDAYYSETFALRKQLPDADAYRTFDTSGMPAPEEAVARTITMDGWVLRYLFQPDVFVGTLSVSGYTSMQMTSYQGSRVEFDTMQPHETKYRIIIEDSDGIVQKIDAADDTRTYPVRDADRLQCLNQIRTYENSIHGVLHFPLSGYMAPEDFSWIHYGVGCDTDIVAPASTPEEASALYYDVIWRTHEILLAEARERYAAKNHAE